MSILHDLSEKLQVPVLPEEPLVLDQVIGQGGIPAGQLMMMSGRSSGKSMVGLMMFRKFLERERALRESGESFDDTAYRQGPWKG